eukprot:6484164-Amphidinium_carterae.1
MGHVGPWAYARPARARVTTSHGPKKRSDGERRQVRGTRAVISCAGNAICSVCRRCSDKAGFVGEQRTRLEEAEPSSKMPVGAVVAAMSWWDWWYTSQHWLEVLVHSD